MKGFCYKCKKDNVEIEESHDIPKYLGGMDCDGRHWLCINCHNKYERTILSRCFIKLLNRLLPFFEDRKKNIKYTSIIKNSPKSREAYYFAWEVKKEWWGENGSI